MSAPEQTDNEPFPTTPMEETSSHNRAGGFDDAAKHTCAPLPTIEELHQAHSVMERILDYRQEHPHEFLELGLVYFLKSKEEELVLRGDEAAEELAYFRALRDIRIASNRLYFDKSVKKQFGRLLKEKQRQRDAEIVNSATLRKKRLEYLYLSKERVGELVPGFNHSTLADFAHRDGAPSVAATKTPAELMDHAFVSSTHPFERIEAPPLSQSAAPGTPQSEAQPRDEAAVAVSVVAAAAAAAVTPTDGEAQEEHVADAEEEHVADAEETVGRDEEKEDGADPIELLKGKALPSRKVAAMVDIQAPEGQDDSQDANDDHATSSTDSSSTTAAESSSTAPTPRRVVSPLNCHICTKPFHEINEFYDALCPNCARLNHEKREQSVPMRGAYCVVTGGRIKIGYETCLKLLRAGANVIATTRFPNDAALRFSREPDSDEWFDRLRLYALDLRDLKQILHFVDYVRDTFPRLDVLVNNAAQTIRRPPAFYRPLLRVESAPPEQLRISEKARASIVPTPSATFTLEANAEPGRLPKVRLESVERETVAAIESREKPNVEVVEVADDDDDDGRGGTVDDDHGQLPSHGQLSAGAERAPLSVVWSQLPAIPEDHLVDESLFPVDVPTEDQQPLDLRTRNSWVTPLEGVSIVEIAEVQMINSIAPTLLIQRLKDMLSRSPPLSAAKNWQSRFDEWTREAPEAPSFADRLQNAQQQNAQPRPDLFWEENIPRQSVVINVTACEGIFNRAKGNYHPASNMAKAALNMLTRTIGMTYREQWGILVYAVDTGWVTNEVPVAVTAMSQTEYLRCFTAPLDEIDGAARILDPIFTIFSGFKPPRVGRLYKDYRVNMW